MHPKNIHQIVLKTSEPAIFGQTSKRIGAITPSTLVHSVPSRVSCDSKFYSLSYSLSVSFMLCVALSDDDIPIFHVLCSYVSFLFLLSFRLYPFNICIIVAVVVFLSSFSLSYSPSLAFRLPRRFSCTRSFRFESIFSLNIVLCVKTTAVLCMFVCRCWTVCVSLALYKSLSMYVC